MYNNVVGFLFKKIIHAIIIINSLQKLIKIQQVAGDTVLNSVKLITEPVWN